MAFIPPGAISLALIARMNFSLNAHLLRRQLGQLGRVEDIFMHEESAPTALKNVEMLPVERNTWTDNLHIACSVVPQWLARTEGNPMLAFQYNLLLE
jgi:hypothetical protein